MAFSAPSVTVIVGTYNAQEFIGETIKSVISQTIDSWELLVIDDCSTDETRTVVKRFVKQDPRIHLLPLDSNSNRPAVPRNVGIREAQGGFLAFLDHDDVWFPKKLERHLLVHLKYPLLALTHSAMWHYPNRRDLRTLFELPNPLIQRSTYTALRQHNQIYCSSVVMRRDTAVKLGGFDENAQLRAIEDYELWLRVAGTESFAFIQEVLGYYRTNPSSTYSHNSAELRLDTLRNLGAIDRAPQRRPLKYRALRKSGGIVVGALNYGILGPLNQWRGSLPLTR